MIFFCWKIEYDKNSWNKRLLSKQVVISALERVAVFAIARIVYIGQSGSGSSGTLKNRIRQMLRFGRGARVDHWGGRLVWQLRDAEQLQVCWKEIRTGEPKVVETQWIQTFKSLYDGKRPFANLQG